MQRAAAELDRPLTYSVKVVRGVCADHDIEAPRDKSLNALLEEYLLLLHEHHHLEDRHGLPDHQIDEQHAVGVQPRLHFAKPSAQQPSAKPQRSIADFQPSVWIRFVR